MLFFTFFADILNIFNKGENMDSFKIIAEIGGTHIGSLERAKNLAKLAKIAGAHIVKTQKRNPKESVKKELWDQPHPNQIYSYGKTYLEHRQNLELSIEEHAELKVYCESIDIEYSTSVWDMTSAKEVVQLNPKFIKIPSACNHNKEILNYLLNSYKGEVHISLGMTTKEERVNLLKNLQPYQDKVVAYLCTSGYPVPHNQLYLLEISNMLQYLPNIGFSNHSLGLAMGPVAYALGARYFEYHFIDDRTYRHQDAACSLEPQGLSKLVRDLRATEKALQYKPDELDEIEKEQKDKLRL